MDVRSVPKFLLSRTEVRQLAALRRKVMLKWPVWIGVVCEDLEAQRKFYRDTLGLSEVRAEKDFVWFELENKLFELLAKSEKPQYDRRRVSFAFEVDDIRATRADLLSQGVEPVTDIEGGPDARQYWAYFKDTEENLFEVVQRLPRCQG
jgi:catechol 2,3-dioxygenase-like lactoylglutathione lyase family enzyme